MNTKIYIKFIHKIFYLLTFTKQDHKPRFIHIHIWISESHSIFYFLHLKFLKFPTSFSSTIIPFSTVILLNVISDHNSNCMYCLSRSWPFRIFFLFYCFVVWVLALLLLFYLTPTKTTKILKKHIQKQQQHLKNKLKCIKKHVHNLCLFSILWTSRKICI